MSNPREIDIENAISHLKMASQALEDADYDYDIIDSVEGLVDYLEEHEDEEKSFAEIYREEEE